MFWVCVGLFDKFVVFGLGSNAPESSVVCLLRMGIFYRTSYLKVLGFT
jgi:hypothetical protein